MESVGSFEAKTHLPQLPGRAANGEEFAITEHGKPVAKPVPAEPVVPEPGVKQVIADMRAFRKGNTPGEGITIRDLIEEGRRY